MRKKITYVYMIWPGRSFYLRFQLQQLIFSLDWERKMTALESKLLEWYEIQRKTYFIQCMFVQGCIFTSNMALAVSDDVFQWTCHRNTYCMAKMLCIYKWHHLWEEEKRDASFISPKNCTHILSNDLLCGRVYYAKRTVLVIGSNFLGF